MKQCRKCKSEIEDSAKFCSSCGAPAKDPIEKTKDACPDCGAEVKPYAKFCRICGTPQVEENERKAALKAEWGDVETEPVEFSSQVSARYKWGPMFFIPVLFVVFWLLSFPDQTPVPQAGGGSQMPTDAASQAQMQHVKHVIDSMRAVLQENPADTTALLALGEMFEVVGKYSESREFYLKFLEQDESRVDIKLRIASTFFGDKDYASAATTLAGVLEKEPENIYALYNQGLAFHMLKRPQQAKEAWQKVVELDPGGEIGKKAVSTLQTVKQQGQSQ